MSYVYVKNAVCRICMNIPTRLAEWLARGPIAGGVQCCASYERKESELLALGRKCRHITIIIIVCVVRNVQWKKQYTQTNVRWEIQDSQKCPVEKAVHPDKCPMGNTVQSKISSGKYSTPRQMSVGKYSTVAH